VPLLSFESSLPEAPGFSCHITYNYEFLAKNLFLSTIEHHSLKRRGWIRLFLGAVNTHLKKEYGGTALRTMISPLAYVFRFHDNQRGN
jgi:hypothetical protein